MKSRWGIGIIITMTLFIAFILTLVVKTYDHKVDLVADDYYDKEIRFQMQLDRMNNVDETNRVTWEKQGENIVFQFASSEKGNLEGTIDFFRLSNSDLDKKVPIRLDDNFRQTIPMSIFEKGKYSVKVDWKVNKKSYYLEEDIFMP